MKNRILFICAQPFFQWRGSPIRVGFDARALAESGFEVDLLTLPVGSDVQIPGVNIIRVMNPLGIRNVGIGPSLVKAFFNVLLFFKAAGMLRRCRYTAMHCVEETAVFGVVLARLAGIPVVYEKHSDPVSYRSGFFRNAVMKLYAALEGFAVRNAAAVIATGEGLAAQARRSGGGAVIHSIPDIPSSLAESDPGIAAATRTRLGCSGDDILVMYAGSFAGYQGVEIMFDAIPLVARRCAGVKFVIIGGSRDEIARLSERFATGPAAGRVVLPGLVAPDSLPDYLAASDILLSPRLSGINTPLKLLDYLKAGRAIVATDTPANRLILHDGMAELTGVDAESFANGICRLATDSGRRRILAGEGARLLGEKHNYGFFRDAISNCYRQLGVVMNQGGQGAA